MDKSIKFHLISLFPEIVSGCFEHSITGRAAKRGIISLNCIQLRDFAINDYGSVDDTLYGGGRGMLIRPEPVYEAFTSLTSDWSERRLREAQRLYLSPKGQVFDQNKAQLLSTCQDIILLCGHYEGVDYRVLEELNFKEISVGNFILTGGEIAAALIIDAVARLVPHVLPDSEAHTNESLNNNLLEERQYTRPAVWRGRAVPSVLQSGNFRRIEDYRSSSRLQETLVKRPDLLSGAELKVNDFARLLEDIDGDI